MNSRTWRRVALFGALALVLVLSAVSGKEWEQATKEPAAPSPTRRAPVARAPSPSLPSIELERLQRRDPPADTDEAPSQTFAAKSWHVPPPPPPPKPVAQPAPPAPPAPPPMPFTFLGRYEDGARRTILLVKGDRIYTVAEGDVIEQTYRVERLAEGQLELRYLPLDIKQTLNAGGS